MFVKGCRDSLGWTCCFVTGRQFSKMHSMFSARSCTEQHGSCFEVTGTSPFHTLEKKTGQEFVHCRRELAAVSRWCLQYIPNPGATCPSTVTVF